MKIVAKLNQVLLILCVISFLSACNGIKYSSSSSESNADSKNTTITDIDNSVNGTSDEFSGSAFCDGTAGNDGPGGFLWKPVSEGDGNLVILFPKEFSREFLSVKVERITETSETTESGTTTTVETELEFGEFDGYFEDGRQVWRFSAPGSEYTGKVFVDDRSQECIWEIEGDPAERND